MKKLLLILLCLPMIFSSCQEDDLGPSVAPTSSSSSVCGTATLTVGGTNYTLNNPLMNTDGTCSKIPTLHYNSVSFQNMYSNNWEHEWALKLQFFGDTIGTPILGSDTTVPIMFLAQLTLGSNTNDTNLYYYQSYLSNPLPNGEITITYIDTTNHTIDGNFSCTVYHVYTVRDSTNLINSTNIPPAIRPHCIVYVDYTENPSAIVGYHDNIDDTWYNDAGIEIFDPACLAHAASGELEPYLATNSTPQLISGSFSDIPLLP